MSELNLETLVQAPARRNLPKTLGGVRPDATRVIYSPLVGVVISPSWKAPFGAFVALTLREEWFPVKDIPASARHRVSPDPSDPGTWGNRTADNLPAPSLASTLTTPDLILARVMQTYGEMGCREVLALQDKTSDEIRDVQLKLFGTAQMRTFAQTVAAIKEALDQYGNSNSLLVSAARELMTLVTETKRACELYWGTRKVEIMRAANGDKSVVPHPDNYDLRLCEFAGIDVTKTEAEALRAEVLANQLESQQAPAGPKPEEFAELVKSAVVEGVKVGLAEGMKIGAAPAQESKPNSNRR